MDRAIAGNLSRNFIRQRANQARLLATQADCPGGVPRAFSDLRRALRELPSSTRVPLMLYYFDAIGAEGIAATLGISPKAVHMRLSRARGELRKLLEKTEAHNEQ